MARFSPVHGYFVRLFNIHSTPPAGQVPHDMPATGGGHLPSEFAYMPEPDTLGGILARECFTSTHVRVGSIDGAVEGFAILTHPESA